MNFYYLGDRSAVGTYNGLPYNFHPTETPEQWEWFQDQLRQHLAVEVPRPPDPVQPPDDPAEVERHWREGEMRFAQLQVTSIEYGDGTIDGSAEQWKAYWLKLRKWTGAAEGFPNPANRPVRPA